MSLHQINSFCRETRKWFLSVEIWIIRKFFLICRMKSFGRGFYSKNCLFKTIQKGRTMCSILDQFKNLCEGVGVKFVFKFESIIPEIEGHALAEGSRLSVPAPRRVQIFFQVCLRLSQEPTFNLFSHGEGAFSAPFSKNN